MTRAGAPFVCLNTLVGGLAAYGLAGLRAEPWAVAQFALMLVLQSLVAIQVMVLSVYITPNQARARALAGFITLDNRVLQGWLPPHPAAQSVSSVSRLCYAGGPNVYSRILLQTSRA